ncbi:DEKNAAC105233 [Brettanomyces naardenensis]|uniref:DEKNAAC105233 n=1 Tax=Brettanomyces naardenensis TaxID=13370 RepID=A0A448YSM5_BRENA|nr:DEKNAAC105233 [Brettanomyces naardenensis]
MIGNDEEERIANSMGSFFKKLPDELIMSIVSELEDPKDLVSLMDTSRFFYGFVSFDEIWRNLYLDKDPDNRKRWNVDFTKWRGSWKKSILRTDEEVKVDCGVVYSDLLFTPYQNTQIDYRELFHDVIEEEKFAASRRPLDARTFKPLEGCSKGRIPRIEESTMTIETFNTNWYNYPFILKDTTKNPESRWPKWTMDYLMKRFPDEKFRQESVDWPLSLYGSYASSNKDEKPLYLFDCNSHAMKYLVGEFEKPPYAKKDLLEVLGGCRPDHTWMTVGPERSGSGFHKDPNSTCAWNTVFQGAKLWVMLPPDMTPPGVHTDTDESEVTSPVGVAEWVLSGFYNDSVRLSEEATDRDGLSCVIGMTFANECMFVPAQWWHTVINFEDTVALTANFVPDVRLGEVLSFFKNKQTQMSGFHPIKFNRLLKEFVASHRSEIDSKRLAVFEKYLEARSVTDTDEDVGELKCLIDLPVFELFVELLKEKGYEGELERGLKDMKGVNTSRVWEKLKSGKDEGFKFAFSM